MKQLTILVDADGVLEDFTQCWAAWLNEKYGENVRYEDIREWDMTAAYPGLTREQVYGAEREPELYDRLQPIPGAQEYLRRLLDDGHRVLVVTNTPYQAIAAKMERFMERAFPFLTWRDFILTAQKQLIRGDVLIDDGIHNLLGGDYAKILFTAPYNEDFDAEGSGMIRVGSWEEIYRAVCRLAADD